MVSKATPNSDVKAVIDALGGVEKFATKGEGGWNYYEFRDMYEKLIRKEVPGGGGAADLREKRRS